MIKKILFSIPLFIHLIHAETIFVPDDFQNIQDAINVSDNGDSIFVSPGVYFENLNFNGKLVILSSNYILENDSLLIGVTIIDAQGSGSVVTFNNSENNNSVLQGFTLQNGAGNNEDPDGNGSFYTYGGGIYCENSNPVIRDCLIQNNTADEGGGAGIFCFESSPIFYGCTIVDNETDDVGGGLYARDGSSPTFYNCVFNDNTAEFGGGCYLKSSSSPLMDNVIFSQNTANNSGGAIGLKDDADLEATNLFVINNIAEGLGGGFYINNADPFLSFVLISDNVASSGAGIYVRNNSEIAMSNLTSSNNNAGLYGNGIYMRDESTVNLLNSIIWGNGSSQIYFRSEGDAVELNVNYSIIEGNEDGIEINDNGDLNWLEGNIDSEPYFCSSSSGNYYVRENSPCVNGGLDGAQIGCFSSGCGPVNLGPVWYVDQNGDNESDGSIETPFKTIEKAVSIATDGDTIRLNPGVYVELIEFEGKQIVLESRAFELDSLELVSETYFAPGPLGGTCFTLEGNDDDNIVIRGLSFRGGSDPFGGGIVISNCSPVLENIFVTDNTSEIGGGIYLSNSDAILKDIQISNNGGNLGGGLYITGGSPYIDGALIHDNIAYWGGGIYLEDSNPTINNSIFQLNQAFIEGAGIYQNGGSGSINWTSFENNNGYDYGGGVAANQATISFSNTTFVGNIAGLGSSFSLHSSAISITNSILWDNQGSLFYSPEASGFTSLEVSYSDVEGGENLLNNLGNTIFTTSGGIIDIDPNFCDPASGSFNLQEQSLCLTASESSSVIGAYENTCESLEIKHYVIDDFSLRQNYPNPFNPKTTIAFSLERAGHYSLEIFNLQGKLIKTLKNEFGHSGDYSLTWNALDNNGRKVTSGVYVYALKTNSQMKNNKMILLK